METSRALTADSNRKDSSTPLAQPGKRQQSRTWPEQFIEHISEPCLEYVHFMRSDGTAFGPVIGDGPGRKIVPGRPPDPLAGHVQIIVQVYRLLRTGFGRGTAHGKSIAPCADLANSQYFSRTRTGQFLSLPGSAGLLPLSGILAPGRTSDSQSRPQAAKRWRDSASLDGMELVWRAQDCRDHMMIVIALEKRCAEHRGYHLQA